MTRPRLHVIAAVAAALLVSACATLPAGPPAAELPAGVPSAKLPAGVPSAKLPAGVPTAPPDDPAAAILTLPSGRSVPVYPQRLRFTGSALLVWPDGRRYDGDWVDGQPHGAGSEHLADGSRYQGGWQRGLRHGIGELREADGSLYRGEFVEGRREGSGTLTGGDGTYRGSWSADVPHGEGVFEAADGARYEGEWVLGQRSGRGRFSTHDGASYDGDWNDDQPHGFGRLEEADGGSYDGAWVQGRRTGYGRSEGPPGLRYEGTWKADRKHGFGREDRPDGSSYLGHWRNGKRDGQGLEMLPDGGFHDGVWELDQPLGPGQRRSPAGIEISGVWNGETASSGVLTLPGGAAYAGRLFKGSSRRASATLVSWLRSTAARGDPFAQLLLGTFYLDMEEPPRDVNAARQWLGRAARAGVAEAQFRLALTYEAINPPRVVELLAEAGRQDHPLANETLGEYYYGGITVPRNLTRAIGYYQRAVDGGSVTARNNLAWLLATADDESQRDGVRAVALIRPIALYSGHWQYLDTLAAAWAAAGDFSQAVIVARQAIAAARRAAAEGTPTDLANLERRLDGYRAGRAHIEPPP